MAKFRHQSPWADAHAMLSCMSNFCISLCRPNKTSVIQNTVVRLYLATIPTAQMHGITTKFRSSRMPPVEPRQPTQQALQIYLLHIARRFRSPSAFAFLPEEIPEFYLTGHGKQQKQKSI